jgi:hypothetical protein
MSGLLDARGIEMSHDTVRYWLRSQIYSANDLGKQR